MPPWKYRLTKKVLGPADSSMSVTLRLMPVMAEAMAMTTMTPMATPRMVSAARTLLARSESRAMPTPSTARLSVWDTVPAGSFGPERHDGIEPAGAAGGVHARDHADADAERRRRPRSTRAPRRPGAA